MVRMILLAGASLAALVGTAADAATFAYTGSVQTYAVTQTGIYTLRAAGAQGGKDIGGLGASVSGRLSLASGATLNIIVGGRGASGTNIGGGGGGTFIYRDLATPFAVAGGGGGGYTGVTSAGGGAGLAGVDGGTANGSFLGGTAGSGGEGAASTYGGGGGGWVSDGGSGARGGRGGPNGFNGGDGHNGVDGGFGGGGGGGYYGGGGGGGFSGGGGGGISGGAGGGSFLAADATDTVLTAGVNAGDGSASIDLFSATGGVPEPSSWAMLITGFGGIGAMLRRRRLRTA